MSLNSFGNWHQPTTPMRQLALGLLLVGTTVGALAGEDYVALTPQCETAIARSALPEHLRERSNVWLLGRQGYERVGDRTADFSCIVVRNHPGSLIPQCFDGPGQRAILPKHLEEGRLLSEGKSFADIKAHVDAKLASREYDPVEGRGLVYMMSDYNYIYAYGAQRVVHVHPHVMFHAPDMAPEAVGNNLMQGMQNRGLPFVIDEGVHGYVISMVERPADTAQVTQACAGQLPDRPPAM